MYFWLRLSVALIGAVALLTVACKRDYPEPPPKSTKLTDRTGEFGDPLATVTFTAGLTQGAAENGPSAAGESPDFGAPPEMVYIPGGTFRMGFERSHDDERPIHVVTVMPFFLDRHEVTNRQFKRFVEKVGYVTQAERKGYSWCFLKGADD